MKDPTEPRTRLQGKSVTPPGPRLERCLLLAAMIVALTTYATASSRDDRGRGMPGRSGRVPLHAVQRWTSPPVDVQRLLEEDWRRRDRPGTPRRIGYPMKTDLSPANSGTWEELPGGDRLWRLRLHTPGALWTVVGLETFRPEPGARLVAYDPARVTVLGPFTSDDVRAHGQLWFPPIDGDTVVLELAWPAVLSTVEPNLRVGTVSHGYKDWGYSGDISGSPGDDDPQASAAGTCNVDVNCSAGDDWQDQKRGVVQLLSGGYAFCTGSLVNNTAADCRPYVLTAAHCAAGPSTTFRFNYERPGCESGSPPTDQTRTGATLLASYATSDFTLLEMDQAPPESYAVYYNGWRRTSYLVMRSTGIHHPSGDVKKISHNDDPLQDGSYWGPSHWRVNDWEIGTTERGSSGSPLFDTHGRIIGQLHGGTASCDGGGWDEYGKLSHSWQGDGTPGTRLRDWLDPLGTGAITLSGLDATACQEPRPDLRYAGHDVDDAAGNGDGLVDPGETVVIPIRVANDGTLTASGVTGTLAASSPLVTIVDGQAEWPNIAASADEVSESPSFTVRIDPGWICGSEVDLELNLSAAESPGAWSLPLRLETGSSDVTLLFSEDVEGMPDGWTISSPLGSNPWAPTTARSSSPVRSWFVGDPAEISESLLTMQTLAAVPAGAVLRFEHFMNSEAGYDGGVLEFNTGGTTWLDVGPLIIEGAYNSTINPSQATPLTGRPAWTGDLGGWQTVVVDLSSLAGGQATFRWRFASDASMGDEGWYVDDVVVTATTVECTPVAPELPGEPSAPGGSAPPFTLGVSNGEFLLSWGAPASGGPVTDYALYSVPIGAPPSEPACERVLEGATTALIDSLPDSSGFLVVARNASGEGPYGSDSAGTPRQPATATPCP